MMTISPHSSSISAHLTLIALLSATTIYCFYKSRRLRTQKLPQNPNPKPKLFFLSQTGTSKTLALRLQKTLISNDLEIELVDPKFYEPEDLHKETLVLIVASTWEDGKPPPDAGFFANWLAESADDFRVGSLLLKECKFAVFGVGSRVYGENFNAVGREFSRRMSALGGSEILSFVEGDVDGGDLDAVFEVWSEKIVRVLKGDLVENGEVCESDDDLEMIDDDGSDEDGFEDNGIVDLEDIAGKGPMRRKSMASPGLELNEKVNGEKEMVTPVIRASLEKQVHMNSLIHSCNQIHIHRHRYQSPHQSSYPSSQGHQRVFVHFSK